MNIKAATLISTTGIVWLLAIFVFQREIVLVSSPMALFIICTAGLLISFRYKLAGGVFLFFGGFSLTVHPFMFLSSFWLVPGAVITGLGGFLMLINWWQKNGN